MSSEEPIGVEPLNTIIILIISVALCLLHYFTHHRIAHFMEKHDIRIMSFSGGVLIALLFLILLPEVLHVSHENPYTYLYMLIGFLVFHLAEKFIYHYILKKRGLLKKNLLICLEENKNLKYNVYELDEVDKITTFTKKCEENRQELLTDLKKLHEYGFFFDHIILGMALVLVFSIENYLSYLLLIPIILQIISASLCMECLDERAHSGAKAAVLSIGPIIGTTIGLLLRTNEAFQSLVMALSFGMLMFIVIRDIIPKEEKGSPRLFILGIALIVVIWVITQILSTGAH